MKKKHEIVGIIPANKSGEKNERKKMPTTQFWRPLVSIWFSTYAELLPKDSDGDNAKPCFDSVETFQMKIIIRELKKRAEEKNIEWNEKVACERFKAFLLKAWEDDFISKNFMLRIISNNKTKIFNNQVTQKKNGQQQRPNSNLKNVGRSIDFDKP